MYTERLGREVQAGVDRPCLSQEQHAETEWDLSSDKKKCQVYGWAEWNTEFITSFSDKKEGNKLHSIE